MPSQLRSSSTKSDTQGTLQWLALSLTPGVGSGRGRKLVEMFGGTERLFAASLTELEAAGIPAAAAQSIALGKSMDLAGEELDRVTAAGADSHSSGRSLVSPSAV